MERTSLLERDRCSSSKRIKETHSLEFNSISSRLSRETQRVFRNSQSQRAPNKNIVDFSRGISPPFLQYAFLRSISLPCVQSILRLASKPLGVVPRQADRQTGSRTELNLYPLPPQPAATEAPRSDLPTHMPTKIIPCALFRVFANAKVARGTGDGVSANPGTYVARLLCARRLLLHRENTARRRRD